MKRKEVLFKKTTFLGQIFIEFQYKTTQQITHLNETDNRQKIMDKMKQNFLLYSRTKEKKKSKHYV